MRWGSILLGLGEVAVGALLIPPGPEDAATLGASIAPSAVLGVILVKDGLNRLG